MKKLRIFDRVKTSLWLMIIIAGLQTTAAATGGVSPRQQAERFLGLVIEGQTGKAFDYVFTSSLFLEEKKSSIDLMKRQAEAGLPMYGKALKWELVHEKKFGDSVIMLACIMKMEKGPLVWEFAYYRATDRRGLAFLRFNDELKELGADPPSARQ